MKTTTTTATFAALALAAPTLGQSLLIQLPEPRIYGETSAMDDRDRRTIRRIDRLRARVLHVRQGIEAGTADDCQHVTCSI